MELRPEAHKMFSTDCRRMGEECVDESLQNPLLKGTANRITTFEIRASAILIFPQNVNFYSLFKRHY